MIFFWLYLVLEGGGWVLDQQLGQRGYSLVGFESRGWCLLEAPQ